MTSSRSSIQPCVYSPRARTSGVSIAGWTWISVTPGCERVDRSVHPVGAAGAPVVVEVVGEHDALVLGEAPEREAGLLGAHGRRQPDRQRELDGELEVDVEELGAQGDRGEVRARGG